MSKTRRARDPFRVGALLAVTFLLAPRLVRAQPDTEAISEGLRCFEETSSGRECGIGTLTVSMVTVSPSKYDVGTVDAMLDGLEQLALTSTDRRVRTRAVISISTAGRSPNAHPGVVARLEKLFQSTDDPYVRAGISTAMFGQSEVAEAVAFLWDMAQSETGEHAMYAVEHLASYGNQGRGALQRLHSEQRVSDHRARMLLNTLAKNSFTMPGKRDHSERYGEP